MAMSAGDDQTGCSPFMSELVRVRHDPKIIRRARQYAGSQDLADDGLQETFYRLAICADPSQILNLRAYFCAVLYHEIDRQRPQVVPVDPDVVLDKVLPWRLLPVPAQLRDISELAEWHLRCEWRLTRFRQLRTQLLALIPASSPDPGRYRALILSVTHRTLREAFYGSVTKSEINADLRSGYPEWLDPAGCSATTRDKRLSRARRDLMAVLTTIDPDWEVTL